MRSIERRLRESAARGAELDLAGGDPPPGSASWPPGRDLAAVAVRDLLLSGGTARARGVRLRGARLVGVLDLEGVTTPAMLVLRDCYLPDGVVLQDATMGPLR